ncbi:uncharacterized protein KQ657_001000 [Scheffersomyces spartinae]|uniref:Dopey N-terminal domain-containing protein n=1 Tax=Scheffersomyces spartinae TaxID=45513 RepID=A0A9P7V9C6_9ASCO|nr:uncharacterized protein KQ657_001000 [Scheffersomyces spartinae]KAG7193238.1 hypothetical protein KQ657_001000 [Scheffersomyces spartinae]
MQQVDRALGSFETLEEWADYIAFLSRLQKNLLLGTTPKSVKWIPRSSQVANRLALCLSSQLPNGVHQKTLSIYQQIFNSLTIETLDCDVSIWLAGLLPVLSYCSIQVKPLVLDIYRNHILKDVSRDRLRAIIKPLILSLLPGMDDENSEVFNDVIGLVDEFKRKLLDDSLFWYSFFLCIISNPERRLGALYWCNRRLPLFNSIQTSPDGDKMYTEEARACLTPESGLLVRALTAALDVSTKYTTVSDIIIIRGYFDLLLSRLSLDSLVINKMILKSDKKKLMTACCEVTLKKDMSLNRRIWSWLLGPDSKKNYFETYGLDLLVEGILDQLEASSSLSKSEDYLKICYALIIDKWEINQAIAPKLVLPILEFCYQQREKDTIVLLARTFMEGVELKLVWKILLDTVLNGQLEFGEFILRTFDCNDQDCGRTFAPLIFYVFLVHDPIINGSWVALLKLFLQAIPRDAFITVELTTDVFDDDDAGADLIPQIHKYFEDSASNLDDSEINMPISIEKAIYLSTQAFQKLIGNQIVAGNSNLELFSFYSEFLYIAPPGKAKAASLISIMLESPVTSVTTMSEAEKRSNLLLAFSLCKILNHYSKHMEVLQLEKLLRIILTNLWTALTSHSAINFQVEAVKAIFDLELTFAADKIEAGILNMLRNSLKYQRVRAFTALWKHSTALAEGESILVRPLQLLLDSLYDVEDQEYLTVVDFVSNVIKNGSVSRLIKLITNPLLDFEFLQPTVTCVSEFDDLGQFRYYLKTILNVMNCNKRQIKEALSNELVVMDSTNKMKLFNDNNWSNSTYKSFIYSVLEKYLQLTLSEQVVTNDELIGDYLNCTTVALELYQSLIIGSEKDFHARFHTLMKACSYYIHLDISYGYEVELIETKYLECIFHFLTLAEELNINLNLLHVEDEQKDPLLVQFIIQGIENTRSGVLMERWVSLLTRSLYLFNESVFSVIFPLNDALIKKIESYFNKIIKFESFDALTDADMSINMLLSGVNDLLSISHSYLISSNMKDGNSGIGGAGVGIRGNSNSQNDSFFGNVIQGVFLIESPAIRTSEQNKLFSILLSFHDAIKMCFKIWSWSDSKPVATENGQKSVVDLAHRLKFRARKLLELLMDLERQEVIECLILVDLNMKTNIKLLSVLDGGRSQLSLPCIFDSIISRCHPQTLDAPRMSSMNVPISAKDVSNFLLQYIESIDSDTISQIWNFAVQFFKDVLSYTNMYRAILPEMLKIIMAISLKLSDSNHPEVKKNKKELADIFLKVFNVIANSKSFRNSDTVNGGGGEFASEESEVDNVSQEEVIAALSQVVGHADTILEDLDKVNTFISSTIQHIIIPKNNNKKSQELTENALKLLQLIGKYHPNKAWKSVIVSSFSDHDFFNQSSNKIWQSILSIWVDNEKLKLSELKFTITSNAATNLFNWNESSEDVNKIYNLKRMTYLILIKPKDYFLSSLNGIFDMVEAVLSEECSSLYRREIINFLRAITLRFSEMHLLSRWTVICQQLLNIFQSILGKSPKELIGISTDELALILSGCKLLDQLLVSQFDEFNLLEWLFVSCTGGNPSITNITSDTPKIAFIDRLAAETDFAFLKDQVITIDQPLDPIKPLLAGCKRITSITSLRAFFQSLSLIHYERTYGLFEVDFIAYGDDILCDIEA